MKYFVLYWIECAENKITQKMSMKSNVLTQGGLDLKSLDIEVEKHNTDWSNFDVISFKPDSQMRLSCVRVFHVPIWPPDNT